jgi:hypothetical protein
MRLTSALAERSGTERDDGFVLKGVAALTTLHMQAASAQSTLAFELRQSACLHNVLAEATEELTHEAYGQRREIALWLAVVGQEDQLMEALRWWVRRTQETRVKEDLLMEQRFDSFVSDAGDLLALIDGAAPCEDEMQDTDISTGSMVWIVAAWDTVSALVEELQLKTERRMQLEQVLGRTEVDKEGRMILPLCRTNSELVLSETLDEKAALPVWNVSQINVTSGVLRALAHTPWFMQDLTERKEKICKDVIRGEDSLRGLLCEAVVEDVMKLFS